MIKRTVRSLFLLSLSFSVFAKTPNVLCVDSIGDAFPDGDGSIEVPYLICNQDQLKRLSTEPALLGLNFKLGADLNFQNAPFQQIGSEASPFTGSFNGDGYVLSSIFLSGGGSASYVAPFANVSHARVENLTIDGMTVAEHSLSNVGGMIARAAHSTLHNLHVTSLNMKAPNRSGGLVGTAENTIVTNCSTEGIMTQHFGSDASGGLIGYANQSDISACSSSVKMLQSSSSAEGVSDLGGLIGLLKNSHVRNVYATGDFDYFGLQQTGIPLPQGVGGLIGSMENSILEFAYYAGKMQIEATRLGGAVGTSITTAFTAEPGPSDSVFWDKPLSGVKFSAEGSGKQTATLKRKSFWKQHAFSQQIWSLVQGQYPTLLPVL